MTRYTTAAAILMSAMAAIACVATCAALLAVVLNG